MKVIIAGSRTIYDYDMVKRHVINSRFHITEVVNGTASGVDYCGCLYAAEFNIPITNFEPDWKKHGKGAGIIRNGQMAEYADAAVIIVGMNNGEYSPGSMNMLSQMVKRKKRRYVVFLKNGKMSSILMDELTEKDHKDGKISISETRPSSTETEDGLIRFFESADKPNRFS